LGGGWAWAKWGGPGPEPTDSGGKNRGPQGKKKEIQRKSVDPSGGGNVLNFLHKRKKANRTAIKGPVWWYKKVHKKTSAQRIKTTREKARSNRGKGYGSGVENRVNRKNNKHGGWTEKKGGRKKTKGSKRVLPTTPGQAPACRGG